MKYILATALSLLFFAGSVWGQTTPKPPASNLPKDVTGLFEDVKVQLKEPDSEVEDAIVFLLDKPEEDRDYIKFFSTYAVPAQYRDNTVLTLSFVIHSLIGVSLDEAEGVGGYYPLALNITPGKDQPIKLRNLRLVPGSTTLYWIDLRECNWTPEAWEKISELDGYFVSPVIDYNKYGVLKLLSGNAVVRADWFILHATDMSQQTDTDRKTLIYDTLLYAKNKIPKNIEEWRKVWGINVPLAQQLGADYATLVTKSKAVSKNGTRILFGYRTPTGYAYDTYDVKNLEGFRDYAENIIAYRGLPPTVLDGGENFTTNQIRMQVYALRNAQGDLVPFADATIVRHMTDVLGDARVITGRSCMDCHAAGPIPAENTLLEFIRQRNKAGAYKKADQLRIDRVFLSNKFEEAIVEDQVLFAKALLKINGLAPEKNHELFLDAIQRYAEDVTLEQAAFECGLEVEDFKKQVSKINSFRVAKLISPESEAIPRHAWETPGKDGQPGLFQQCMIQIKGLTAKITETRVEIKATAKDYVTVKVQSDVKISDIKTRKERVVGTAKVSEKYEIFDLTHKGWIGIIFNGEKGYIEEQFLVRE